MLKIIAGRSGSGKTEAIHRLIQQNARKRAIVLLVPEQSSFQNEKRILDTLGARASANISVLSFKRLYETVSELYGGNHLKRLDDGAKAVLMSTAAEAVSEQLTLYSVRSKKNDFADLMLGAVNEFKMCGIKPSDLYDAANKTTQPRLSRKLRESAAIYEAYDALLYNTYSDPDDDLVRLYELLCEHPYFEGKDVYIDSFNGFSGQERKILECIIQQAESVVVSLCCDKSSAAEIGNSIFQEPDTTLRQLRMIAEQYDVEIQPVEWMDTIYRYKSDSLKAIEESVFRFDGDAYDYNDGAVKIYEAKDEYDEIHQVCREIRKLVREEQYAYRDITVIFRDPELFKNLIVSEFPKYHIPYFMSAPQPLKEKPLIRLILSAFEVIHSSFNTESILTYLKTDMTSLSQTEVYLLENYAYLWDIKGSRWKRPFTMNPNGNEEAVDEEELEKIEALRKKAIEPLLTFSESLSKAENGGDISKAVFMLLQELGTAKKMKSLVSRLESVNDTRQKETEARVWDIAMKLLDKMYTVLGSTALDSRRYEELLKLMIRKNALSDIPQTLDHVMIGTAGNIRLQKQKAVFVIGALEGVFPIVPTASGLFSDSERTTLIGMELPLYDAVYGMTLKEKFNAYSSLALPSEKLFVSCCLTNSKGETCEPSVIIKEIQAILPKVRVRYYEDLTDEEKICTEQQSFEECASLWHSHTALSATLKEYYAHSKTYFSRFSSIERMLLDEPYHLSTSERSKRLFGEKLTLSASQVESFYQCPFRYFCRYGLKAYPRKKATMDAGLYGSTVHFILEQLMKNEGAETLKTADESKLQELIDKYITAYLKEIGSEEERSERFMAQFRMIERNLALILRHMIREMNSGSFVPTDFELEISDQGDIPAYELKLPDGNTVQVVGKVDRVDTYVKDQCKYIRIIDYKTGNKKFRLSDVLYGLNIQMLLYLSIINKNGQEHYSEDQQYSLAPAGILYFPSTPVSKTGGHHSEETQKAILKDQQSSLRMNGLLINDPEIIEAMEKDCAGVFIPAKLGKDGKLQSSSLTSLESYGKIFSYLDKKLLSMANALYGGKIGREPVKGGGIDGCQYCDYRSVCAFEEGKAFRRVDKKSNHAAIEEMCQEEENKDE